MQRNLRIVPRLVLASMAHSAQGDGPQSNPPNATGPSALKNLTLEELSQIEVTTPSKEPSKVSQTPSAIYVITGEDIRRSGATCIPEALRLAPGVEVARIDSNKWSIGIRGFGSRLTRSVLVLIDGRTVYTPLFDGTYWEVQDTMMEDIDRIEVIRGPGGTIWGPNAVNGVINVITKSSKDTRGMLATAGGGDFEQGFADFRYGGGNDDGFSYRICGKGFTRGPEDHSDGRYTKGVEIAPEWRPKNFIRLRGSYSFLHMNIGRAPNSQDVGTAPGIVGSSPQHQVSVQLAVDFSKRFQADLDYRYVSALPGQLVPAYTTGDARFGWRISRQLELSIVGQNLLQPSHPEDGGDPGPLVLIRRSAYARLTWSR